MKVRHLEILCAVVECGSLTGAAKKLYSTQPSLSLGIKELENELGVILLQRTVTGAYLTPVGEIVYEYANKILQLVQEIQKVSPDQETMDQYELSLASNFSQGSVVLTNFILQFQQIHRVNCKYIALEDNQDWKMLERNLTNCVVDLAFVAVDSYDRSDRMEEFDNQRIIFEPLYNDEYYIVVRKNHPFTYKSISLFELKNYLYVYHENDLNECIRKLYGASYCLSNVLFIASSMGIEQFLLKTDAFSVVTAREWKEMRSKEKPLTIVPIPELLWTQQVGMLYRAGTCTRDEAAMRDVFRRQYNEIL